MDDHPTEHVGNLNQIFMGRIYRQGSDLTSVTSWQTKRSRGKRYHNLVPLMPPPVVYSLSEDFVTSWINILFGMPQCSQDVMFHQLTQLKETWLLPRITDSQSAVHAPPRRRHRRADHTWRTHSGRSRLNLLHRCANAPKGERGKPVNLRALNEEGRTKLHDVKITANMLP